ncbi:hypothetical protein K438DRAFT_1828618 [Mycena galopus ATCC 62051]|nr:hypothetical protein K438DRAFT_1828618 [Mycena galopus ATCC 62051]
MACALLNASCVLLDLFLVFLVGDGEQTLEARSSQFFRPVMSQVRLSGPVGVLTELLSSSSDSRPLLPISTGFANRSEETVGGRHGEEDEDEDCPSRPVARAGQ